jgi:hypothetical protein
MFIVVASFELGGFLSVRATGALPHRLGGESPATLWAIPD